MSTPTTVQRRADAAVLRRIWRLHFWVGLFAAPALVLLACSGLVILYTQPLNDWLNRDLYVVVEGAETVPLDDQIAVAQHNVGQDYAIDAVTPPAGAGSSTRVDFLPPDAGSLPAGESNLTQASSTPTRAGIWGSAVSCPASWGGPISCTDYSAMTGRSCTCRRSDT
jgi:uncharacterized iron-regulated membrane protein